MQAKRRILITGASGDLGRNLVRELSETHCVIGAHYFDTELPESISSVEHIYPFRADLTKRSEIKKMVNWFSGKFGGIDVLVQLSGGLSNPDHWTKLTEEDWNYDININLSSVFFIMQECYEALKDSNSGRVVLTSTASVKKGGGIASTAYSIAKAGIECLTKQLARDMAKHEVLINCIAPGYIGTRFHTLRAKRTDEDLEKRRQFVPLGRAGTPEEVTKVISFLISEDNGFITGEIIRIDGGDFI
jgi:3-oxoacyl-[acyl-carrier protein] reductase